MDYQDTDISIERLKRKLRKEINTFIKHHPDLESIQLSNIVLIELVIESLVETGMPLGDVKTVFDDTIKSMLSMIEKSLAEEEKSGS